MKCGLRLIEVPQAETRKPVSVLFNDVAESTALGERLEPESLRRVMWRYYETVARVVRAPRRHGREVHRRRGDGGLRHPGRRSRTTRCARCGRRAELRTEMEVAERRSWSASGACGSRRAPASTAARSWPAIRAGGQALVTGDAVNVAARLEQSAAPGEILIGSATRAPGRGVGRGGAVGAARGARQERAAARRGGCGRCAASGQAPRPAGRAACSAATTSCAALREAFERVTRERTPRLVTVLGPAGIGKSRLARELATVLCRPRDGARSATACPTARESPSGRWRRSCAAAGGADPRAAIEELLGRSGARRPLAERVLQAAGPRGGDDRRGT